MKNKPNLICIVSDTLRTSFLGCYGNDKIYTPNIDKFAEDAVIFDNSYPESLPTIPVRRALHTGRRAYPFNNYQPVKWDIVYLPGWQPMANDEDTLAENLARHDYYTGFVTDTLPYFAPGFNFTRGFWQWKYIRGQQQDRWQSAPAVPDEVLTKYGDPEEIRQSYPNDLLLQHVANTRNISSEEETTTARTFRWAMDFVDDNRNVQPFYLLIDCFDPHEPWDAPDSYLDMYADPEYSGKTIVHTHYGPADQYTEAEINHIKANYCGLVSLLDSWFGKFIDKLKRLQLYDNSVIAFLSDHGTNFTENPENIIGKPHYALYPPVMKIPQIVRFPGGIGRGTRSNELVYNLDVTATFYDYAGLKENTENSIDGKSLLPLAKNKKWEKRSYVTSRYNNTVWYFDKKHWIIMDASGEPLGVFDVTVDPDCNENIVKNTSDEIIKKAWDSILNDAGGELPVYDSIKRTDAIGQKVNK